MAFFVLAILFSFSLHAQTFTGEVLGLWSLDLKGQETIFVDPNLQVSKGDKLSTYFFPKPASARGARNSALLLIVSRSKEEKVVSEFHEASDALVSLRFNAKDELTDVVNCSRGDCVLHNKKTCEAFTFFQDKLDKKELEGCALLDSHALSAMKFYNNQAGVVSFHYPHLAEARKRFKSTEPTFRYNSSAFPSIVRFLLNGEQGCRAYREFFPKSER